MTHAVVRKCAPLVAFSFIGLTAVAENPTAKKEKPWRPEIPRVWDEEAIATIELPLVSTKYSPKHISSEYYYSIPIRPIYKSYPIYHPDKEPPGYWEWLQKQEPEFAFDSSGLETKEDWVRAGEIVFKASREYASGAELDAGYRDPKGFVGVQLTPEGVLPYEFYVIRERGKVEAGFDGCGSCHTRAMADGTVILGGPGNIPIGTFAANEIRDSIPTGEEQPVMDKSWMNYHMAAAPWMNPDPGAYGLGKTLEELAMIFEAFPPGVLPRERTSLEYPVKVPDLIGVTKRRYLDATGLVQQRNLGDLMRYATLNEGIDELASYGGFRPAAEDFKTLPDPSTLSRKSDEQLYALALFLDSLRPPPNPNPSNASAKRGEELFEMEGCTSCHRPPLYSNNRLVAAPGFDPPAEHRERFRISRRRVGTDPGLTLKTRRGTGYYKVPSLRGVWYRGPFLHSGYVATLEDMFNPRRLDKDYVPTGFLEVGVSHRPVLGHEFGLDLTEAERKDLLAFLRTL